MDRHVEASPSMVDNLESTAAKGLIPRRHCPLTVTQAVDSAVVVGAASFVSAAATVLWWHRHRTR
jgi:hypothetical protein